MNTIWILLLAADVIAGVPDAKLQHQKVSPGTELSVRWNVAHTQAIVKISGGKDAAWQQNKAWMANALAVYDESTHDEIFKFIYKPEWQSPEDDLK